MAVFSSGCYLCDAARRGLGFKINYSPWSEPGDRRWRQDLDRTKTVAQAPPPEAGEMPMLRTERGKTKRPLSIAAATNSGLKLQVTNRGAGAYFLRA
jgi:hypothetical protein